MTLPAILTVTVNAALDRTWLVPGLKRRGVNRPARTLVRAGGKGVNVARAYACLGGSAVATGFVGGATGRTLRRALAEEGIGDAFLAVPGETRTCAVIVDPDRAHIELYEAGAPVARADAARLLRRIRRLLAGGRFSWLVLSGSLPPGVPDSFYADAVRLAHAAGVSAAVDAAGPALAQAIAARPALVKPNRDELRGVAGPLRDGAAIVRAADRLRRRGAQRVVVTLGDAGAIMVDDAGARRIAAMKVAAVSAVGSGDCFLAGLIAGLCDGDAAGALRLAAIAGADNCRRLGAGTIDATAVRRLERGPGLRVTALPAARARAGAA
ncbi:MAG TPA: hexose kinase [Planctomycetota bacterium]|nr:hexose kinase [Planctomycetota bacterium]